VTGWRTTGAGAGDLHPAERAGLVVLAAAVVVSIPVWVGAQLAAFVHTGHAAHLSLPAAVVAAFTWPKHAGDPVLAFPAGVRAVLGSPPLLYATTIVTVAALVALGFTGLATTARVKSRRGFASGVEVRRTLSATAARNRGKQHGRRHRRGDGSPGLYLGRDLGSRQRLFGAAEDSYLYLGPPRSGKGVHLIIPQTIDAPGPALVTATRADTLQHTLALRAGRGPVAVFDPQGLAGAAVPRLRWAPQRGCADPLTAIARARALAAGAQLNTGAVTDGAFWQQMTEAVLRCYLHAAALDDASMRDVLGWVARPGDPAPVRILRTARQAAPGWAEELVAQSNADPRTRDSVWAGVRRSVDALADPRVLDACSPPAEHQFDTDAFLRDGGSLYLLGTTGAQLTVAPLITALVEDLVDAARRQAAATAGGRLDPPLTLLLDEAANIAPIPSLPNLLADGGGSGITTVCVLQSLAQARARWGPAGADAMWDSSTTKVVLGGLAHADDLARISRLAGDVDDDVHTRSYGPNGPAGSVSPRRLPALPVERLRTLPVGHAIVLARRTPPVHAVLTPWWSGPHADRIRAAAGGALLATDRGGAA
jgi:type IV secretory pathway TraG/TraD family ATPase VirD4